MTPSTPATAVLSVAAAPLTETLAMSCLASAATWMPLPAPVTAAVRP